MGTAVDTLSFQRARRIVQELCAIPGIAGMYGGRFGEIALYYPFERVHGLRLGSDPLVGERIEVHLIADISALFGSTPPAPLAAVADVARAVVVKHRAVPVDIIFEEVSDE